MTEQPQRTYPTILRNLRKKEIVIFDNQLCLCTLFPGDERTIKAIQPWSYYARYSEVTWRPDGFVHLEGRDDFREPDRGKWVLKALNMDGKDYEAIVVAGLPYNLPRGIPVLIAVPVDDPLVVFQSLELRNVERFEPDPAWLGYLMPVGGLESVKTERPAEELEEINKELAELAAKEPPAPTETQQEI